MKRLAKHITLFAFGAMLYVAIEILWRGHSHRSMLLAGGMCFLLIGGVNNYIDWEMRLCYQVLIGVLAVTAVEFIAGCIVNLWLGLRVWDYTKMPMNLWGQICVPYMLLWVPLVCVGILLDDLLRWKLFGEARPYYRIGKRILEI